MAGESETWNLSGYEMMITSDKFKAGNGTLEMKNANEYMTDFFQFDTHVVINGEDRVVHSSSVTGTGVDIAKKTIGSMEGGTFFNKGGERITFYELSDIYMIVEWWNIDEGANFKERIDLFSRDSKKKSFLN